MLCATPSYIFPFSRRMYSPLKCAATLRTDNFASKGISILIFTVSLFYAFFFGSLFYNPCYSFKFLVANYWLMVILNKVFILFSIVYMPIKFAICIRFCKITSPVYFFIFKNSSNCSGCPTSSSLEGILYYLNHLLFFEFLFQLKLH